jgi:hypothetical protein
MAVVCPRPEVRNEFCAAMALVLVLMTVMDTLLQMCLLGLQESNMRSCYLMIRCLSLKLEQTNEILQSGKELPLVVTNKKATQLPGWL